MAFAPKSVATYSKTCLQFLCRSQSLLLDMLPHQLTVLRWSHTALGEQGICVRGGDSLDKGGRSQDNGGVLQTLPLQAWDTRQWDSAAQGSISLEKAPDLCLQLLIAQVPALQGARWIGELPGSSFLKRVGPWVGGVHARKGLVWVWPASLQAHREVAPEVVWCLTAREGCKRACPW